MYALFEVFECVLSLFMTLLTTWTLWLQTE